MEVLGLSGAMIRLVGSGFGDPMQGIDDSRHHPYSDDVEEDLCALGLCHSWEGNPRELVSWHRPQRSHKVWR